MLYLLDERLLGTPTFPKLFESHSAGQHHRGCALLVRVFEWIAYDSFVQPLEKELEE
jgi:hypothetical protein